MTDPSSHYPHGPSIDRGIIPNTKQRIDQELRAALEGLRRQSIPKVRRPNSNLARIRANEREFNGTFQESFSQLATLIARHGDQRLLTISGLLSEATSRHDANSVFYREGLLDAAVAIVAPDEAAGGPRRQGLTPWQQKRLMGYMLAKIPARVEVDELAQLIGLSASHVSRSFKASTGVSPYRWQLQVRIELAQNLLRNGDRSVEAIASKTGFVDGAHLTRTFVKIVGETPGAWRRATL